MDLYKILNVAKNSSHADIKSAYRKLALALHPDRTGNDPKKAEKFREISSAYSILGNEEERRNYDRTIRDGNPHSSRYHSKPQWNPGPTSKAGKTQKVDPKYFNEELWRAWHYGDGASAQPSYQQQTAKYGFRSSHEEYFARKLRRDYDHTKKHNDIKAKEESINKASAEKLKNRSNVHNPKGGVTPNQSCAIQ